MLLLPSPPLKGLGSWKYLNVSGQGFVLAAMCKRPKILTQHVNLSTQLLSFMTKVSGLGPDTLG